MSKLWRTIKGRPTLIIDCDIEAVTCVGYKVKKCPTCRFNRAREIKETI